jgi:hypothetical protein
VLRKAFTVTNILMDKSGFIAVYENDGTLKPGQVLGTSGLLQSGQIGQLEIPISRQTVPGETIYVIMHIDDGDGVYNFPESDPPAEWSNGGAVMIAFVVEE